MQSITLPDGWREEDLGDTVLFFAPPEDATAAGRLRFVYLTPYFGGDHRHTVTRITDDGTVEEFSGLGQSEKAKNVLQDRLNRWPQTVKEGS